MDLAQISQLVDLVASSHIAEVDVSIDDASVRIKNRQLSKTNAEPIHLQSDRSNVDPNRLIPTVMADNSINSSSGDSLSTQLLYSPYVGRIQWGSDSAAEPCVMVGRQINKGDIIGYVIAMGRLLAVTSQITGRVEDLLVTEGQPVEYGTPLLMIYAH